MGVSLNGGTPISHPKMIIFSRKTPWLLGKPTILGNTHIPPNGFLSRKIIVDSEVPDGKGDRFQCSSTGGKSLHSSSLVTPDPKNKLWCMSDQWTPPQKKRFDSVVGLEGNRWDLGVLRNFWDAPLWKQKTVHAGPVVLLLPLKFFPPFFSPCPPVRSRQKQQILRGVHWEHWSVIGWMASWAPQVIYV